MSALRPAGPVVTVDPWDVIGDLPVEPNGDHEHGDSCELPECGH
jgi:hypothetical protein